MTSFADGIINYFKAFRWIFHRRIFPFAIIPGIMALLFSGLIYYLITSYATLAGDWLLGVYPFEWGSTYIDKAADWLTGIFMLVIGVILFKYIILILSGPFMSPLSERLEGLINGVEVKTEGSATLIFQGFIRGIRITFRNLFLELFLTILLYILGFFPLFSIFSGILIIAVQAYYAGFGNMDYTLERYYNIPETADFVRRHKMFAIGNGFIYIFLLFIPVIGALFAVPLGAIGATIGCLERIEGEDYG
jgi:CysZ protein